MSRLLLVAAITLVACAGCAPKATTAGSTDGPVRHLASLVGQPLDAVMARYDAPESDSEKTYQRGASLYEQETGLQATVLDTLSAGTSATVRRVGWTTPNRAVWAVQRGGRWVVVDAMEWDADVQF